MSSVRLARSDLDSMYLVFLDRVGREIIRKCFRLDDEQKTYSSQALGGTERYDHRHAGWHTDGEIVGRFRWRL